MAEGRTRGLAGVALAVAGAAAAIIVVGATSSSPGVPQPAPAPVRPFTALLLPPDSFFARDPRRIGERAVFGWYLTCCGAFGGNRAAGGSTAPNPAWPASPLPAEAGVAGYEKSIRLAQAAGYDGLALDEFATARALTDMDKANISAMFEAARRLGTGFRLYFVFDEGGHDPADYRNLLATYARHPNYFRYQGLPVASAYGARHVAGTVAAAALWWGVRVLTPAAKTLGEPIFWVPVSEAAQGERCTAPAADWRVVGSSAARGLSAWQIQTAPLGGGLACLDRYADGARAGGLAWIGTFSWHYWAGSFGVLPGQPSPGGGPSRWFEHGGGSGLARSWASLIGRQAPAWVTMLTANDYQESYGETVGDYRDWRLDPGNGIPRFTPPGWYRDQSGMADLNRYYIQWYRTGRQPAIVRDAIFASYRTVPQAYVVPARNRFTASIGDGRGGAGTMMTVRSVADGYVTPGETIDGGPAGGLTIMAQTGGAPFAAGTYLVSDGRRMTAAPVTTYYRGLHPIVERNGEPTDPLYLTVAVTAGGAIFAASGDAVAYASATLDDRPVTLPVRLAHGLHQLRIAPFHPGAQRFTLSRGGKAMVDLKGVPISAGRPVYDFFPATAAAYGAAGGKASWHPSAMACWMPREDSNLN